MSCDGYPKYETFLPPVKRIIAIGDIHGDLAVAKRCFRLAKLIDSKDKWIGGKTIVVQVGDQIDSCRPRANMDCTQITDDLDDVKVIEFFDEMNRQAMMSGGAVYSLLGNHELLNAIGDFRYVSKNNVEKFNYKGVTDRYTAFKPGGIFARHMACTRQSVLVIGSNMFVHAGILPDMLRRLDGMDLSERSKLKYINMIVRKWLLNILPPSKDTEWIEYSEDSPFWTRVYAKNNSCLEALQTLKLLQLDSMIIGHTPQSNISVGCDTVYRIDTGMSKVFPNNRIQVLEILDDKIFQILSES